MAAPSVALRARGWRVALKVAALLLAALLAAALLAACGSDSAPSPSPKASGLNAKLPSAIRTAGVLNVLTVPEVPPVSYYKPGSTTEIVGSDPDMLQAIGKVLGVRVQFMPVKFDQMLLGVESGRGDVAAGGLTDTAERERKVTFVDNFILGERYVVRTGNTTAKGISHEPLSACGHVVAFTIGAVSQTVVSSLERQCFAAGKPGIKDVGVEGIKATILAVLSGRADVALYDDLGFEQLNKANGNRLQSFRIDPWPNQYWGFAVRASNRQLADALLSGLEAVIKNGEYARVLSKYGVENGALAEPGINLQTARPQG